MECYHHRTSTKIIWANDPHCGLGIQKMALVHLLVYLTSLKVEGQFNVDSTYFQAYADLEAMLEGKHELSFKHAVNFVENAFFNNKRSL